MMCQRRTGEQARLTHRASFCSLLGHGQPTMASTFGSRPELFHLASRLVFGHRIWHYTGAGGEGHIIYMNDKNSNKPHTLIHPVTKTETKSINVIQVRTQNNTHFPHKECAYTQTSEKPGFELLAVLCAGLCLPGLPAERR